MEREPVLRLRDVSFSYRPQSRLIPQPTRQVFRSLSFDLFDGESLGIIGRNGSGKSSLLRLIARIVEPTTGTLWVRSGATTALLSLGLGFRADLSGRDNALLAAMLQGFSKKDAKALLDGVNDFAELGSAFDDPVKTYSAGMRARLGFASAVLAEVDILLIDEVLSVGDAHFRDKAMNVLQQRIRGEQTVVFVSHAPAHVRSLCDRAIWIEKGEVAADGAPEAVLGKYDGFMKSLG